MKIKRLPTGNVSIILENDQELNYLYAVSNVSVYSVKENAEELGIQIKAASVTNIGVDLFYGLRKLVEGIK